MYTECPVAKQYSPIPVGWSKFRCYLNLALRGPLGLPNICVGCVVVLLESYSCSQVLF